MTLILISAHGAHSAVPIGIGGYFFKLSLKLVTVLDAARAA